MLLTLSNICRYQCLILGKKVKTIGNVMIDTGIINNFVVNQDQCRVRDCSIGLIVIRLYSTVTVGKILLVEGQKNQTT